MENRAQTAYEIKMGDDLVWLFETDDPHPNVLVQYIQDGITNGDRILIVVPNDYPNLFHFMSSAGIFEWKNTSRDQQIRIYTQSEIFKPPHLQTDEFFGWLETEIALTREAGYPSLRISVPIDRLLSGNLTLAGLLNLESQLRSVIRNNHALALWQVPVDRVDPLMILGIIASNQQIIIGDVALPALGFFAPGEINGADNSSLPLYRWIKSLAYRRNSEQTLEIHDRWFREIFDAIYQFVGVLKPDGTLIEINRAALDLAGAKRSDVIGHPFWKAPWWSISPQIRSQLKAAIKRAAGGEFVRYPVDMVGHGEDGPFIRRVDFSLTPVFDAKKQVVLIIPEARDLTEIIHTQQALEESDLLLQSVISSAPIVLFLIDRQGTILLSTGKGRDGLSQSRANTVGESIYKIYRDYPPVIHNFQRALIGESFKAFIDIDGHRFDTHYSPFIDSDGKIIGVLGVATDVTGHKNAVDALYTSQARFQIIFEKSGLGISLEDLDGRVVECNPAFQNMLGYSADELRNKKYTEFTHPADMAINLKLYQEMVAGKLDSFHLEKRYIRKDGKIIWGRLTTSHVLDPNGKPEAIIVMVEDITTMKQMQAELAEVQRRLMEGREQERLHLAQEIHDGPLQEMYAIVYKLKELEAGLTGDHNQELLKTVQEHVHGQINMLRSIAGELRPPLLIPFGLEKAIQSHAESFMTAHPEIKVKCKLMPDKHRLSEQVRKVMFRIYQELMNNIVRHANATQVTVHLHIQDDQILLDVQDDGQGFKLPKRWIELARQNHLGLVGAQERAESIGGYLIIDSDIGKGTHVRVVIPHQPAENDSSSKGLLLKNMIDARATWSGSS